MKSEAFRGRWRSQRGCPPTIYLQGDHPSSTIRTAPFWRREATRYGILDPGRVAEEA
jgi:hypothetical protein